MLDKDGVAAYELRTPAVTLQTRERVWHRGCIMSLLLLEKCADAGCQLPLGSTASTKAKCSLWGSQAQRQRWKSLLVELPRRGGLIVAEAVRSVSGSPA